VEQRDHPEWRGKPVVVGAPPDKRGVVSAASYEARKYGIHSAMPSREAGKKCPHAIFVPVNMHRYEEVSAEILKIFESFTPLIEPLSLDEAFLDVTGAQHLFGNGPEIAAKIRKAVRAGTGLSVSVGVASNKFLAKIASDLNKPDGLTVVPVTPAEIRAFLAPLPVGRLWGVGDVTRTRLEAVGLRTIGDIQKMSVADLARRVGKGSAEFFKELAEGRDDRPVETEWAEKSLSREYTFDTDVSDRREVERVLVGLVEDVGSGLRRLGKYVTGVQIKLRWQGFKTITRQMKLAAPRADDFCLLEAAKELFGREKLIKPVRLIGFGVHGLVDHGDNQAMLFEEMRRPAEKRERMSRTIDTIRERFGKDSLRRGGGKAEG
jgi:DNA polymerase-4